MADGGGGSITRPSQTEDGQAFSLVTFLAPPPPTNARVLCVKEELRNLYFVVKKMNRMKSIVLWLYYCIVVELWAYAWIGLKKLLASAILLIFV